MTDSKIRVQEYREGNKDFLVYEGYTYKYSNPLKYKQGKNWKCVITKCIATIKSEVDNSGKNNYTTKFTHDHQPGRAFHHLK